MFVCLYIVCQEFTFISLQSGSQALGDNRNWRNGCRMLCQRRRRYHNILPALAHLSGSGVYLRVPAGCKRPVLYVWPRRLSWRLRFRGGRSGLRNSVRNTEEQWAATANPLTLYPRKNPCICQGPLFTSSQRKSAVVSVTSLSLSRRNRWGISLGTANQAQNTRYNISHQKWVAAYIAYSILQVASPEVYTQNYLHH